MKKSDKMRQHMAKLAAKPAKKGKKAKKQKKAVDADINKDGKVDEKDASLMEKIAKKIRRKKD